MTSIADESELVESGYSTEEHVEPVTHLIINWELVNRVVDFVRVQMPGARACVRMRMWRRIRQLLDLFERDPRYRQYYCLMELREEAPALIETYEHSFIKRIERRFGIISQPTTAHLWKMEIEVRNTFLEVIFPTQYAEYCMNDKYCLEMLPAIERDVYTEDMLDCWWGAPRLSDILQIQHLYMVKFFVSVPPRPPRVEWWRHTEKGKRLNWNKRGKSVRLVQVLTHQNLKKRVAAGAFEDGEEFSRLSEVKAGQMGKIMNPHKEEWPTPEKECHVTGRRVTGVKRLRWEADPICGPEPKRRRVGDASGWWVILDY